jgi:23S rRNA (adenine2503-C2)-methyltransferase
MNRYGATRPSVEDLLSSYGEPQYRTQQVWDGLYGQRSPLDAITTLPRAVRERLDDDLPVALELVVEATAADGLTTKWLWAARRDGIQIETVLMRSPTRATVCVSSQAGCAMACTFCATGQADLDRHLDAGEIVEQVVRAQHHSPQRVSNVVFMGMGEPLANYDPV